jgi:hypothetical protein
MEKTLVTQNIINKILQYQQLTSYEEVIIDELLQSKKLPASQQNKLVDALLKQNQIRLNLIKAEVFKTIKQNKAETCFKVIDFGYIAFLQCVYYVHFAMIAFCSSLVVIGSIILFIKFKFNNTNFRKLWFLNFKKKEVLPILNKFKFSKSHIFFDSKKLKLTNLTPFPTNPIKFCPKNSFNLQELNNIIFKYFLIKQEIYLVKNK